MIAASLRFFSGRLADRTRAYWTLAIVGYVRQPARDSAAGVRHHLAAGGVPDHDRAHRQGDARSGARFAAVGSDRQGRARLWVRRAHGDGSDRRVRRAAADGASSPRSPGTSALRSRGSRFPRRWRCCRSCSRAPCARFVSSRRRAKPRRRCPRCSGRTWRPRRLVATAVHRLPGAGRALRAQKIFARRRFRCSIRRRWRSRV